MQLRLRETRFQPPGFEPPRFQASSSEPPRFQASTSEPPGFQTLSFQHQPSFPAQGFPLPRFQPPLPRPRTDPPHRTMELPVYEGGNADEWLFRLEQCFLANLTREEEKLEKAISCLTGASVTWWRCY